MDKSPEIIPPKELSIKISGRTKASLDHPEVNEDTISFNEKAGWAVLLDGMGGLDAGDRASQMGKDVIVKCITRIKEDANLRNVQQEMVKSFTEASEQVRKKVPGKSGTTAVAVKIVGRDRKAAIVASVGDSRAYLSRRGKFEQITQDDSPIPPQLRDKLDNVTHESDLDESELGFYNMRRYLTQNLGQRKPLDVHTYMIDLSEGDKLVLTSDGVHDNLTKNEIQGVIEDGGNVANRLVEISSNRALQKGAHFRAKMDDISAVIIEFSGRETSKSEIKTPSIAEAQSFDELYQSLNSLGEIRGSRGSFTAAELASLIDLVRTQKLDISLITRSEGIREKVKELLEGETEG